MCSGRGYQVLGDFPKHDVFFGYSYEEHVLRSVLVERANGLEPLALSRSIQQPWLETSPLLDGATIKMLNV